MNRQKNNLWCVGLTIVTLLIAGCGGVTTTNAENRQITGPATGTSVTVRSSFNVSGTTAAVNKRTNGCALFSVSSQMMVGASITLESNGAGGFTPSQPLAPSLLGSMKVVCGTPISGYPSGTVTQFHSVDITVNAQY